MRSRPAVKVLLIYVSGIFVSRYFDVPSLHVFGIILLSLFAAFVLWVAEKGNPLIQDLCLVIALVGAGFIRYDLATSLFPSDHILTFTNYEDAILVKGRIEGYPDRKLTKTNFVLSAHEVMTPKGRFEAAGRVLLSDYSFETDMKEGDVIIVRGKLRQPKDRRNPGEFDYREYLRAQDIFATLSVYDGGVVKVIRTKDANWNISSLIHPLKSDLDRFFTNSLPEQESALLRGLLLGERGLIEQDLKARFSQLGIIHILAVSGLHVGFVILILMSVTGLLRLPYGGRVFVTIIGLVLFALLTNYKPPVIRASVMGILILIGTTLERKTDFYNILAIAALVILIANPLDLFQPGFQLSFTAVIAIVYLHPKLKALPGISQVYQSLKKKLALRYVIDLFLVSAAAFIGTLPFTVLYFHKVPLFSLFANILVVPLSFCGLASAVAASVVNPVIPFLGEIYMSASWLFLHGVVKLAEYFGSFAYTFIEVATVPEWLVMLYCGAVLVLFNLGKAWTKRWSIIVLLIVANLVVWKAWEPEPVLEFAFLDVGQGDAVLISFPDSRVMLLDGGPSSRYTDSGEFVVGPYLQRRGIEKIDVMVLSHADADHLGGLPYLLRHFKVEEIWDNGYSKETRLYKDFVGLIDSLKIKRRILHAGDIIHQFDPVSFFVLHPSSKFLSQADVSHNDASLSLKLSYGKIDAIFAGDIEIDGEHTISGFGKFLDSEILKVNHHGSRTSSTPGFLEQVTPEIALISVGLFNKFDHPHPEVLTQLRNSGAKILRTDQEGALILRTDGKKIQHVNWK